MATLWSTSAAVCRAATSMASWSTTLFSAYVAATVARVALLVEAMLEFIAAIVGWFASLRSTEAGVLLPSTWRACREVQGQTGVDRGEAGSVGRDEALRCG